MKQRRQCPSLRTIRNIGLRKGKGDELPILTPKVSASIYGKNYRIGQRIAGDKCGRHRTERRRGIPGLAVEFPAAGHL